VPILDDDSPQDWHLNITTPPPANANVTATRSQLGYKISVDPGPDALTVNNVTSGAGTSGLDNESFPTPPTTVSASTTSAGVVRDGACGRHSGRGRASAIVGRRDAGRDAEHQDGRLVRYQRR
jgi:hypothetical protein